eukprot:5438553-Ditylum_brightwellii.AAC.1
MGTSHMYYDQTVSQTQKLPQGKFRSTSLQPVAGPGFEPGSLAHCCLATVCLCGSPAKIRLTARI